MTRKVLLILLLMFVAGEASGWSPDTLFRQGNDHYVEGEFEAAIKAYEQVIDSGFESAGLYYNLGNAYFKTHRLTMALVNYERAGLLDPWDEDIIHNRELARGFVIDEIEAIPEFFLRRWTGSFVRQLRSDQWAVLSIISFFAALILLLLYLFSSSIGLRKFSFWMAVILLAFTSVTIACSFREKKFVTQNNRALIMSPSVTVKSSPDESGTGIFQLHEGTSVTILDELGDWREIRIADGNRGWVRITDLIKI